MSLSSLSHKVHIVSGKQCASAQCINRTTALIRFDQ